MIPLSDADCEPALLRAKTVAVIGFGSQGRAHALNLRDSGVKVLVGLREASASYGRAVKAGFAPLAVAEAVRAADCVMILAPDESHGELFAQTIGPNLQPGAALMFAHGYSVHFAAVTPPPGVDVIMVAPKGPGPLLRAEYEAGRGIPALIAVAQDASGMARSLALAYAAAIGSGRAAIFETSFREECETDLFGEQAVLCGGLSHLLKAGFETLVEAGYAPEMAYIECVHEVKLVVDLLYQNGLAGMNRAISNTAEYGEYVSGPKIVGPSVKAAMKAVLDDIQSGRFAREWTLENQAGQIAFKTMRARLARDRLEAVGARLRPLLLTPTNSPLAANDGD